MGKVVSFGSWDYILVRQLSFNDSNKLQSSTEAVTQRAVDLDLTKNTVVLINLHKNIFRINTSTILCKSYKLIYTADSAKYWIGQDDWQKNFQGIAKGYF